MPYAMTSRICQNFCWQNLLRPTAQLHVAIKGLFCVALSQDYVEGNCNGTSIV